VRAGLLGAIICASMVTIDAQGRGANAPPDLVRQVRTAIGHGDVAEARRLANAEQRETAAKELSLAIIEIFEGKLTDARNRLVPLAQVSPGGEAALELGLLEIRTGQRDQGRRRLDPLSRVRTFSNPDDYFRLARSARAVREYLLANDAYQRVADEKRPDIQTEWGDLFFERHLPGEAVTNYQKAVEIDPKWVPAMVGLARALADESPEDARGALDAALKSAPEHPDAWLARAEQQLEANDIPAAKEALDHVAKARPDSIDEAALRAAIAYKEGGIGAVEPWIARIRAVDSRSAAGYRVAGEQAARDYRFADGVELAKKAVAVDPDDPFAQFDLGLYLMRTAEEAAARTALDTSWELDKSAPLTKNLLDLLDHLKTFELTNEGPFIFKFSPDEAAVLKPYALPLANAAWKDFTTRYGFTPQGPILVEVFPVHDDFAVRTLGLPGLVGALGACFGRVVTMDSPRARPPGEFSWHATLWHELAHVFTLQLSEYRVPRWLTEGISVYEEHRRQPAWGRELALQFAHEYSKGRTFGVKKLPDAFKRPESLSLAYFEASLVVEHLVALNGDAGLRALLKAYAEGATDPQAFARAFGRSVDDVETSFKAFVEQRYGALSKAMADPPRDVRPDDLAGLRARAAEAPGNFVSQWSLGQALVRSGDSAAARPVLERAATLAPEASGNGSPRALLAKIAEDEGDTTRARREYRSLLTFDHTNVVAARRLAAVAAGVNATDDETYALRLVADLDPFDANTHGLLGRRMAAARDFNAALIEFQAALALGPANLAEAHTDVAEVLLQLNRKDDAKREALLALREAPTFARAQDALLAAIGRLP